MKREYMEELRALVDAIRREGKSRRRAVCEAKWRFLSFLRDKRKLERALVPVRTPRRTPRRIPPARRTDWN
ncbi:MAG: hypothetical protein OSB83_06455 [Planctomycetota bacterium]|nr:hypothetical protein [Planctomycetota bacterium]